MLGFLLVFFVDERPSLETSSFCLFISGSNVTTQHSNFTLVLPTLVDLSCFVRLKTFKLLPISHWLKVKDLLFSFPSHTHEERIGKSLGTKLFFFKCLQGLYDLDVSSFVTFSSTFASRIRTNYQERLLTPNLCRTRMFFFGTMHFSC